MTKAPYIVYTPDKDFVLEKDDISGGGGSGGDSLVVPTFSDQDDEVTCDMTFSQVNEAVKAKKCFNAVLDGIQLRFYQLIGYIEDEAIIFGYFSIDNSGVLLDKFIYQPDSITIDDASYPE